MGTGAELGFSLGGFDHGVGMVLSGDGEQVGPISSTQLRNLARDGTISAFTLVRKGSTGKWVLAATCNRSVRRI